MSPLGGLVRRLLGGGKSEQARQTPVGDAGDANAEDPQRRRRGRRGGRGRRSGEAHTAEQSTVPASALRTDATPSRGDGRGADRGGQREPRRDARDERNAEPPRRQSRWSRPDRSSLEAPLPEDIAFRPAAEGGDTTILPARRRPPPGFRTTGRVLVPGISYVPRPVTYGAAADDEFDGMDEVDDADAFDGTVGSSETDASDGATPAADDEDAARPRRRRGRRGGRGRRRPGDGVSDSATDGTAGPGDTRADAYDRDAIDEGDGDTEDNYDTDDADSYVEDDSDRVDVSDIPGVAARRPAVPRAGIPQRAQPRPAAARPAPARAITPADYPPAFQALGMSDRSLETIARLGFEQPTPVQQQAIPVLLDGRDVVGIAQTGTGKTLAFGIPMVERLDATLPEVQGLILAPTRELATQVLGVIEALAEPYGLQTIGLVGGRRLEQDFDALQARPQIVVGTPGRVIDHLRRGTLSLGYVHVCVLDEADQMLDIGFMPDITRILTRTPRERQTSLFSATMPTQVKTLIHRFMREPLSIEVSPEQPTVDAIEQLYIEVARRDKVRGLRELIDRELRGRTMVFMRTRRGVDMLAERLQGLGIRVGALHGDMEQRRRDRVVQDFRGGQLDILIATNVAARGLDIPEVTHVVNYDVPQNAEEYVHRIGRTGRAGRTGKAITFVTEADLAEFETLRAAFGDRLHELRLELYA